MKTQFSRKGFTLVEIMIVVVIIGLLAALAIPAFKKVRNNAIEKSIINDARQISAAVQQYCSENATNSAPVADAGKFINGGHLSSGVALDPTASGTVIAANTDLTTVAATNYFNIDSTSTASYFTLSHAQYDKSLSSSEKILASAPAVAAGVNAIKFTTVDGQPSK